MCTRVLDNMPGRYEEEVIGDTNECSGTEMVDGTRVRDNDWYGGVPRARWNPGRGSVVDPAL
jgi:hypothetical protein